MVFPMLEKGPVLISGASRGIGRATALLLAKLGHPVGINYVSSADKAKSLVNQIERTGGRALPLKADVGNEKQVEKMVSAFVDEFGTIFGLVNNAGVYDRILFPDLTPRLWEQSIRTNLTGTYLCCRFAMPHMKKGGRIVNLSSNLGRQGSTQGAHYAAAKAGVIGFTRSLAKEFAARSITVNAVAPGPIETDIIARDSPEKREERLRTIPLFRVGQPEEVAAAIAFFLSEKAGFVTGAVLDVNGGLFMG